MQDKIIVKGARANNLKNIDVTIPRDKLVVMTGLSGSGKTTIGRAIIRVYPASGGSIVYDGKEITGKISKELDREIMTKIQMIFQDPYSSLSPRLPGEVTAIVCDDAVAHSKSEDEAFYEFYCGCSVW